MCLVMSFYYNVSYMVYIIVSAYIYFNLYNILSFNLIYCNIYLNYASNNYLEFLSILWTTILYNYFFLIFIFTCLILNFQTIKNRFNMPTFVILFIYFDFSLYSCNDVLYNINISTDLLLTNKLNTIHPPLIYISNCLLLVSFYYLNSLNTLILFSIVVNIVSISILNLLYLGCWWSLQEDNWSEWWGWEFSEILSIVYLIGCLLILHNKINYNKLNFSYIYKNLIINTIAINFLIIQLYLEDTRHNFINYFNLSLIFIVFIFYIVFKFTKVIILINCTLKFKNFYNLFIITNYIIFLIYVINFVYIYIYWSFGNTLTGVKSDYSIYSLWLFYCIFVWLHIKVFSEVTINNIHLLFSTYVIYLLFNFSTTEFFFSWFKFSDNICNISNFWGTYSSIYITLNKGIYNYLEYTVDNSIFYVLYKNILYLYYSDLVYLSLILLIINIIYVSKNLINVNLKY